MLSGFETLNSKFRDLKLLKMSVSGSKRGALEINNTISLIVLLVSLVFIPQTWILTFVVINIINSIISIISISIRVLD